MDHQDCELAPFDELLDEAPSVVGDHELGLRLEL